MGQAYLSDLSDDQWNLLEILLPLAKLGGFPRNVDLRQVINAIPDALVSGYAWSYLPHGHPNSKIIYHYFAQ